MDETQLLDFLSALGEEFYEALGPAIGWENIVPHDGYEVFLRVFKQKPSPQLLASLSDSQVQQLCAGCKEYFACEAVGIEQVRTAFTRTLARWPAPSA
jgi:hypothetical protein